MEGFPRSQRHTFLDAGHTRLLSVGRDWGIVGWRVLRGPEIFGAGSVVFLPFADKQVGTRTSKENTYGATGKSGFLFGIGSDMMTGGEDVIEKREGGEVGRRKVGEGEGRGRI
jgi:hypothetical protein